MEINLTTPALLFPAISLLLLAYTNRFLTLANLIRTLYDRYLEKPEEIIYRQLANLRLRVRLIKWMQAAGVASLLFCVICMMVVFAGYTQTAEMLFITSLVLMAVSLALSLWEIFISVDALEMRLSDLESRKGK